MLSRYFPIFFMALCPLIGIGNQAYSVISQENEDTGQWVFAVYADGYQAKDEEGNQAPVDIVGINTKSKRLTVQSAMNGLDTTEPRLKMRQVLKECWTLANLEPSELKEVLGYRIENKDMQAAIADCRKEMGLQSGDSFEIASTDTEQTHTTCWERLGKTIFSSAIKGAIADFDINKQLVQVKVDNGGAYDHVYYEFS
ncbi:uncharacterized protein ColSpa_10763 [Colletotrichum spaethianum]|uniref:Uncharacterized protein n=1 Tax=Colletotrichum spaethianum TaxID=700344 RepID=A0AA37URE6_9PEZI|nr:uncharacterized protein ColSpa_10763 [Colletotrichum spaethianum]GKT50582.1 hypothetical protein ColSpa_10763 [Colletotrichum spaethianum]